MRLKRGKKNLSPNRFATAGNHFATAGNRFADPPFMNPPFSLLSPQAHP